MRHKALYDLHYPHVRQGRLSEAEPLAREALGITKKTLGPEHHTYAVRLNVLAQILQDQVYYVIVAKPLAFHRKTLTKGLGKIGRSRSIIA